VYNQLGYLSKQHGIIIVYNYFKVYISELPTTSDPKESTVSIHINMDMLLHYLLYSYIFIFSIIDQSRLHDYFLKRTL